MIAACSGVTVVRGDSVAVAARQQHRTLHCHRSINISSVMMMFSISSDICRLGPLPEQIFLCNFRGKITEFVKFNSQRRFNLELNNNFKDFRFNVVNSTFR